MPTWINGNTSVTENDEYTQAIKVNHLTRQTLFPDLREEK